MHSSSIFLASILQDFEFTFTFSSWLPGCFFAVGWAEIVNQLSKNYLKSSLKREFFEIFQYDFCGSSLLLFHSGLGNGSGGVTEINYRSTDRVR